jgi:predicted permease
MVTFRSLASRFLALFRRRQWHERVDEELEFHIGMETEENIRRGMSPRDARAAARRKVGNTTQVCEEVHRMNTIAFLEETANNVRFSFRTMRKNPGFAFSAVLVLALGLGSATAMFSALDRILFRPLPYQDPDRLVQVGMTMPRLNDKSQLGLTDGDYLTRWTPPPEPFEAVTIEGGGGACDATEQQPERLRCVSVESNFLRTFGVQVALGRDFTAEDDVRGAPPVAIISHGLWVRRFGGDPGAVGRDLNLNGVPVPVIGVLPAGFEMARGTPDILRPQQIFPRDPQAVGVMTFTSVFGRQKRGITPEQAQAAITPIIEESVAAGGKMMQRESPSDYRARVIPLREYRVGDAGRAGWLLLASVGGLLLIACVNVTNLILARLAARDREFAVRAALGAGKARLARLALTESLLLAILAGGLGLALAAGLLKVFMNLAPSSMPDLERAALDLRVFGVAVALAVVAGGAVGIWPALSLLRFGTLQTGVRATVAPRPRLRFALVTAQVALTVAMLGGSALLVRSLWNLVAIPLGYDSDRVITMNVTLNVVRYPLEARNPFFENLLNRIRQMPGTIAATLSDAPAPSGTLYYSPFVPTDGRSLEATPRGPNIRIRTAAPGYFETFRIPIVRGRAFVEADRDAAQSSVVLSESAARVLFPGVDPIGHTVRIGVESPWCEVVGIARDIRNMGPAQEPQPEMYAVRPRKPASSRATASLAIRTQAGAADAAALLKQAVADLDPQLPVTILPLQEEVARLTERPRFIAWLLSAFAGLALMLAAMGLYGVASYLVTQRTHEIGVRMALGAAPGDIARQVMGEAGCWIFAGAVAGCGLAWTAMQAIESQLYGVGLHDPLSWIASLGVLCAALLIAVLRPAARAARVDPMEALRAD